MTYNFEAGEVLLIDKPLTWTSFDVVKKVRNTLRVKKIGHADTLDPLATGLLILCTGKFTKRIDEIQAQEKEYSADLQNRGIMKAIWRVVGEYANYSVYDVDDHDELQSIFQGFPMFKYMDVKVTPLAKHPNALSYYLRED